MLSPVLLRRLSLPFLVIGLWSCTKQAPPTANVTRSFSKSTDRYSLKLEYPEVPGVPAAVNKQIAESALIHLEQVEDDPLPFEEFARNLAEDSAVTNLTRQSTLTVAHKTATFLTTRCQTSDAVYYDIYDLKSGRRLELPDLIEAGRQSALPASNGPNEPTFGLVAEGFFYNDAVIPYDKLKGVLKPQYFP